MILIDKLQKYEPYLSSDKIDKHEYHKGEELFPSNQKQIKKQTKVTYSLLGKGFEKQGKTTKDQG